MQFDVIIIGAGATGMMCAAQAGQRGRSVLLIDHAAKVGERIRISGGGRCNFTNRNVGPENFLSQNPHFCRSALAQYGAQDFIKLVERHGIRYHEKTLGAGNAHFADIPRRYSLEFVVEDRDVIVGKRFPDGNATSLRRQALDIIDRDV